MTSSFVGMGSVRGRVLGSLCLFLAAGCSGDASLGGDQKEQGVGKDGTSDDGGNSNTTGDDVSAANGTAGVGPTSTTGTTGATGGGPASGGSAADGGSGGTDGQATTGGGPATTGTSTTATGGGPATGGSGGTTATEGSGPTGDSSGGTGGFDCETVQCLRAIECVESCDGPVLKASCCPCDAGTFDRVVDCPATNGGSGGTGGGQSCNDADDCAEADFCALPEGVCGDENAVGTCAWRPEVCTAEHAPVCGCDGQIYSNACMARGAGVNLAAPESCQEE